MNSFIKSYILCVVLIFLTAFLYRSIKHDKSASYSDYFTIQTLTDDVVEPPKNIRDEADKCRTIYNLSKNP